VRRLDAENGRAAEPEVRPLLLLLPYRPGLTLVRYSPVVIDPQEPETEEQAPGGADVGNIGDEAVEAEHEEGPAPGPLLPLGVVRRAEVHESEGSE